MNWLEILKFVAAIASGIAAAIPLATKLVECAKQVIKERNWNAVIQKVLELMEVAETKIAEGAERKAWVLAMLKAGAGAINYDIDYDTIADMIDRLCNMSKIVNVTAPETREAAE